MKKIILFILIGILIISGIGTNALNIYSKCDTINYLSSEGTEYLSTK